MIQFEPGVTAIVGPNGCGKSNISDAIRWVLGEQSAKSLRGSSMEDVIFNGSSAREPLGLAEVSLTLSNTSRILPIDYDEVMIARRLYRSGESEYLLNNNPVRLRDIHELLMGTGIGTESYSVIEQGKMDVVLNSKPDERRVIFEEAAGITKFKSKKKEALRKLEQTEQNLLRVNDIIQEVKRQIGSIERQAKKAEHYKIEFEKLKELELRISSKEFLLFENTRKSKMEALEDLKAREAEFLSLVKVFEADHAQQRTLLNRLEDLLKEGQSKELETSAEIHRHQDRILLNRERLGELFERKDSLEKQAELSKRRAEELSVEFEKLNQAYGALLIEEKEGLLFLDGVETNFNAIENFIKDGASQIGTHKAALFDSANKKAHVQNELAKVRAESAVLQARLRKLEEEKSGLMKEESLVAEEVHTVLEELAVQDARLVRKKEDAKAKESFLADASARIDKDRERLSRLSMEESTLKSKSEFLTDFKNKHEGLLGGVRVLLEAKESKDPHLSGMIGLLADLLKVESGYELAVEAAFESYSQAVVFDSDENVLRAAEFLRPLKKGRALLLGLQCESEKTKAEANLQGAIPILRYITAEPSVKSLVENLLYNVAVVDDPKDAFRLSRSFPGTVYVTPAGERFEGRIVMGGSLSGETGMTLVGREARLKDFQGRLSMVSSEINECAVRLATNRAEEEHLKVEIKADTDEALKIQMDEAHQRARLAHIEAGRKRQGEKAEVLSAEVEGFLLEEARLRDEDKRALAAIEEFKKNTTELEQAIGVLENLINDKGKEKEALLVRLAETRSAQNHCTAKREKMEKDRNWALESKSGEESRIASFCLEIEDIVHKRASLESESAALEREVARLSDLRDEVVRQLEGARLERERALVKLNEIIKEKSDKESFLQNVRGEVHAHELESAKIQFEIDRLKERIFNAYQVDLVVGGFLAHDAVLAGATLVGEGDIDIEAAKSEIRSQREKLNKMGPVNLAAMQEYDEMKERFDFLSRQEADLIQAKEDLHKAILQINRTTREMFRETFEKIRENFSEYYKLLFGGGSAELILLDEGDVLESGIEIVARPPGKKLQSISLLSGGEKALTAIALLFAIFKVKPSPFCILDEIDAPLDESNVDRFCNVLKDFISGSQFILITHNKRTMNLADAMYGITMPETGTSQVVSVRFSEQSQPSPTRSKDKRIDAALVSQS